MPLGSQWWLVKRNKDKGNHQSLKQSLKDHKTNIMEIFRTAPKESQGYSWTLYYTKLLSEPNYTPSWERIIKKLSDTKTLVISKENLMWWNFKDSILSFLVLTWLGKLLSSKRNIFFDSSCSIICLQQSSLYFARGKSQTNEGEWSFVCWELPPLFQSLNIQSTRFQTPLVFLSVLLLISFQSCQGSVFLLFS